MDSLSSKIPMPLCFAAPVSWYARMLRQDDLCLANERYFTRQTLRNRFYYGTFQGSRLFTIPLVSNTTAGSYRQVMIDYSQHWQNQLINAIQTSYGKSPFFEFYGYRFEKIIEEQFEFLWDLNLAVLEETLRCLKVDKYPEMKDTDKAENSLNNEYPLYYQVFSERQAFLPDLSVLDLLYNEGPDASSILMNKNK